MYIYHIISKHDWDVVKDSDYYEPESLKTDGFIHASYKEQVCKVADNMFKGKGPLLLLEIDVNDVSCEVITEDLYNLNEKYPHIYGKLNIDSIKSVYEFIESQTGYTLPSIMK